jgi:predicted N-acetyltransferase YhbS
MSTRIKPYNHTVDYDRVGDFLVDTYHPGEYFSNWLQPRWEYMHYHPYIKSLDLEKIGVAEDADQIVGVVHFEHTYGQIYFQVHPDYDHIKTDLLDYAEVTFRGEQSDGDREYLALYVSEHDPTLENLVISRGYQKWDGYEEDIARYVLDKPIPDIKLPEGFHLNSLADENDLHKINRVLWRGFNHPGPPPEEYVESRGEGQQAPNFRQDLTIVVVAPDGNYVSYCGMWYVPENRVGYVEPVATDPDYRRMGMGSAAVLESLRRVRDLGAEIAWVGSGLDFYQAIGFKKKFAVNAWIKYF